VIRKAAVGLDPPPCPTRALQGCRWQPFFMAATLFCRLFATHHAGIFEAEKQLFL
jgi:hypothetical protein